jgi:hypothetical protein
MPRVSPALVGTSVLRRRREDLTNDRFHDGAVRLGTVQPRMARIRRERRHRVVIQDGRACLGCGVDRLQGEAARDRGVELPLQPRRRVRRSGDCDVDVVRHRLMEGRQE